MGDRMGMAFANGPAGAHMKESLKKARCMAVADFPAKMDEAILAILFLISHKGLACCRKLMAPFTKVNLFVVEDKARARRDLMMAARMLDSFGRGSHMAGASCGQREAR